MISRCIFKINKWIDMDKSDLVDSAVQCSVSFSYFEFRERKRKRRLFQRQPETNSQYCQVLSGAYSGMLISGTFMFLAVNSKTLHLTC